MPTLDIFNDDAFSVRSLTDAINETPFQPMRLGEMGIFDERGITTTALQIEQKGQTLSLVPAMPRNAPGTPIDVERRKLVPIGTVHLPQTGAVMADEVQNLRAFGQENDVESVQTMVNEKLEAMRLNLDVTLEWQRLGALKGQVLDANGTDVILDMFTTFGVSQQTHAMNLNTDTTKVKIKVIEVKRKIEDALGGLMYRGLHCFCGQQFFDDLVSHPAVVAAYERWLDGQFNRTDQRRGFEFCGMVFEEYRGQVSGQDFIDADEAYAFPVGVPKLFLTKFAPANYGETVNTVGLPYYAKQERMRMNKGVELEAQSNPICINTRPRTVVKLSRTT